MITTHSQIINLWPTVRALAADLGYLEDRVLKWRRRDNIPGEEWCALVAAAEKRGFHAVTLELLASIADRRRAA